MLAPIRMWMGACLSSLRRSGSSSRKLGRRRDGSGWFLTGVQEGLLSLGFLILGLINDSEKLFLNFMRL